MKASSTQVVESVRAIDEKALLVLHVKDGYKQAMHRHKRSAILRIRYAFFLLEYMENKSGALKHLCKAEKLNPALDEDFVIYRYKHILQEGREDETRQRGGVENDIVLRIAYDNYYRQCKKKLERAAHLHMEFWAKLNVQTPDVSQLIKIGAKINIVINEIEDCWSQMQKINPYMPKAVKMYASFLREILNDPESANDLLKQISDSHIKKGQDFMQEGDYEGEDYVMHTYSRDGTPCVCVSGEEGTLGNIRGANKPFLRMFGYTEGSLINTNINIIIPDGINAYHDKFLRDAVSYPDKVKLLGRDILLPAKLRNGYVLMVYLILRAMPSFTNQRNFVATLKADRIAETKPICYLIVNSSGKVIGVSESTHPLFS
jgi:hypothetical protein